MPITATFLVLMLVLIITSQDGAKTGTTPPVLPNHEIKLVPPPVPAGLSPGQSPAPQASNAQEIQAQLRDGVLRLKIGDTWLPTVGSCCFCPDGAEKPLKWEAVKQQTGKTEKR
jgi:hypothetical protein